jgi:hypothetical protein
MTEAEFNQRQQEGKVKLIEKPKDEEQQGIKPLSLDEYQPILEALRRPRRPLSSAPTATPKSFVDMIQFYENGATRRLYIYINATWRYVALT